jgi:biotin synthase
MIAVARILMPHARVRLSAGRESLSREAQVLCMLAGANSIFYGEKLLTTPNPSADEDLGLLKTMGLSTMAPAVTEKHGAESHGSHASRKGGSC